MLLSAREIHEAQYQWTPGMYVTTLRMPCDQPSLHRNPQLHLGMLEAACAKDMCQCVCKGCVRTTTLRDEALPQTPPTSTSCPAAAGASPHTPQAVTQA
ncbi:hypothetical protein E2C01_000675 [Portunus trituberculatus]|uniref:Uncharacterized protein n=1 Tax=Portunus trituberculatus TaxID=210409 RepID=A0A5B7CH73_PORTR|nr:hypothetical protein [Portunus trituberculatus]